MDVSQGTLDVLMFILGSNVTLSEAKQKTCLGWFGLCVWPTNVSLFVFMCVKIVCAYACVFVCVWWHLLCCWLGAERSGLREPQTKEMKAEVTTWTGGTRSARSHNTQIQSHTCKWWEMRTGCCMHNRHAHTADICFSHTENAGGGAQGHALRNKNKVKINQLADKTACCENKLNVLDVHTRTHTKNLDS